MIMAEKAILNESERKERVSMLLRSTDEYINKGSLEKALEVIRNVYQYDIKNMYARAFEERILAMIVDRDKEQYRKQVDERTRTIQHEIETKTQIEVNKKLKEYYKQWEDESKRRETQEKQELELELKAKEAALIERHAEQEKNYQTLLIENRERTEDMHATQDAEELKRNHEIHIEKIKHEYTKRIEEVEKQSEENEKVFSSRELLRFRWRSIEVYKSLMMALDDYKIESEELYTSIRGILDISEEEAVEVERAVKLDSYIQALRQAMGHGKIEPEDQQILENLRTHYGISDAEHEGLVKQVKTDLGIADDNALILLIDDSPDILMFCSYALRKTYKNVKIAVSVDAALGVINEEMPALIICDVMMPDISGFQFHENIMNGMYGSEIKNVPFMFMSACSDDYMKMIANKQGVAKYLAKPTTKEVLEAAVRDMLTRTEIIG